MQANLLFDVFHQGGNITLLAYYCSETQKKAWSVKVELNGEYTSFPVQWEQRTDFEKRYGQASNVHWYSLSLDPTLFYNTLLHPEAIVTLMDESLKEVPLPLGLITNKSELDKRIIGFLRETNRFVLHPHEQARAMAYCLALQRLANRPFLDDEAHVVHLWSHVALAAKQAGWNLPDVNSFQALEATCYRHWGNDPAQYSLVLLRLSSAYGLESEMTEHLEALVSPTEDGAVERRHVLSVLYLKRLVNTPTADLDPTYVWPAERVSRLFKQALWAAPTHNMVQADMAEKMSLTCAVYHRIYHFKTGLQALAFRDGELQNIARRLHQASCGLLGLSDIQDFQG